MVDWLLVSVWSLPAGLPHPLRGAGLVGGGRLPARRLEHRRHADHARLRRQHRLALLGARLRGGSFVRSSLLHQLTLLGILRVVQAREREI